MFSWSLHKHKYVEHSVYIHKNKEMDSWKCLSRSKQTSVPRNDSTEDQFLYGLRDFIVLILRSEPYHLFRFRLLVRDVSNVQGIFWQRIGVRFQFVHVGTCDCKNTAWNPRYVGIECSLVFLKGHLHYRVKSAIDYELSVHILPSWLKHRETTDVLYRWNWHSLFLLKPSHMFT